MSEDERKELFLKELTQLSKKHMIHIEGIGGECMNVIDTESGSYIKHVIWEEETNSYDPC